MKKDQDLHAADPRSGLFDEGEPLPIFQNLPDVDFGADELADMKRSVHELIHARAVEAAIEEGHANPSAAPDRLSRDARTWARRVPRRLRATASAAGLRVAAGFAAVALATSLLVPSLAPTPLQVVEAPHGVSAGVELAAALAEAESLPLVENLDGDAELIQIEDAEISLVVAAIQ